MWVVGRLFCAQTETLSGCETNGIDLNHAHVGRAITNGQNRYVEESFYLKMMRDKGVLQALRSRFCGRSIDRQVTRNARFLNAFAANPPVNGDVLNCALKRRWNFTACMFLLCYWDADQKTEAVLMIC